MIVSFLLLISCKSIAEQSLSRGEFVELITQIESLLDRNPSAALTLLNTRKAEMEQLGVEEKIT